MKKTIVCGAIALSALLACVVTAAAQGGEFVDVTVDRLGYFLTIPKEFSLDTATTDATAWVYRPEPGEGAAGSPAPESGLFTIWVDRVAVETKNLTGLYEIDRKYDLDAGKAPHPAVRDLQDLTIPDGYGYWYKEADTSDPTAMHRWIARVYGNGGVYTVCLAGPFGEFDAWGPVFEQVIASFRLIPMKTK